MASFKQLEQLAATIRYHILTSTTTAGSGHLTSSLSAADIIATLFFGGFFRYDEKRPGNPNNDRLIFSKGHAAPLLYAAWAVAGAIDSAELKTLRRFSSRLEGHPTSRFPWAEAATGSLGQGLAIGTGFALNAKYLDRLPYRTFVLLGDSEMVEGSQWEAIQLAAHYKLNNLIGLLDVNRLGQRGPTMYGHNLKVYADRLAAFGWKTLCVDGHNIPALAAAFKTALKAKDKPTMIIAKTIKGRGVSAVENKNGWHGKVLPPEQLAGALAGLGAVDRKLRGTIATPRRLLPYEPAVKGLPATISYRLGQMISTRLAYGQALVSLHKRRRNLVVLDAEVGNSTYSQLFQKAYPERYFEMYIAEQNMLGAAVGLARRNKVPFVSTFAAFFTRAFDQLRLAPYSDVHLVCAGSHAGVSVGPDGPSQMGVEDIAMFRTLVGSSVVYPSDAVSCARLTASAAGWPGVVYIRTTRAEMPVLYRRSENFPLGGSKTLRRSASDKVTVVAAGICVHEALKAYDLLKEDKILIRVIDLYSIKPIDRSTLLRAARETKGIVTVEDHVPEGGLGEAVRSVLSSGGAQIHSLAVGKKPKSGTPDQLLAYENISAAAIVRSVKTINAHKK